ncbi:MAG: hypothetical protein JWO32_1633 [Bacteroidetes bacterium]|nr:hypothetical protein [Bacteroidota bacterium]
MAQQIKERKIITDKLVVEKTGKTLEEWFMVLDEKGAKQFTTKEIYKLVNHLKGLEALGEWNQNLLATSYQWSRGIRERGQKENGFEISVSKTIHVPVHQLYNAMIHEQTRKKWLKEKIIIKKATENKSARITWNDGSSALSIDFYTKAQDKTQIVIQHLKIKNSDEAASLKEFWSERLENLKKLLEE